MGWLNCARCDERFALNDETHATLRKSAQNFKCPWGHDNHYPLGKTEAEKLRDQLALAEKKLATAKQQEARYEDRIQTLKHSRAAVKGQVTRLKNRAAAGVCPCCNRSFANLKRHMDGQHPTFAVETEK